MSNIAIKGATTGTGTFTIESPATNTDRTLTLPDEAGTVLTSASDISASKLTGDVVPSGGASFLVVAQLAAQSVTGGVETKVVFDTARFDVTSEFDLANDYFKPTTAGYYWLSFTVLQASGGATYVQHKFYKNGSAYSQPSNSDASWTQSSTLMYLNGTTDYAEIYLKWSNTQNIYNDATEARGTHLMGYLVRAA